MKIEKIGIETRCAICGRTPTHKIVFDYGEIKAIFVCVGGLNALKNKINIELN